MHFMLVEYKILETGYPRNDKLSHKRNDTEYINGIKTRLNIPLDKKVIMYAPTWRDDEAIREGSYQFNVNFDIEALRIKRWMMIMYYACII